MIFVKPYGSIIIIALLVFIFAVSLAFSVNNSCDKEGFDTVPLITDPNTKKIAKGYYQVTDDKMAQLPYGFSVDPKDPKKIVPITKVGINMLKPRYNAPLPKPGEKMPDSFYIYDSSLAVLPPNMAANLVSIEFTTETPPTILYTYGNGYISKTQFYENKYKVDTSPIQPPPEVYYTDKTREYVSFLQYGQIMDASNGYGAIKNPSLNLYTDKYSGEESGYKDVSNNLDVQFHDDIDTIVKNNDMYDLSFGEVRVKDQNGNVYIFPRSSSQSSVTYYEPGSFTYSGSLYVPNYEDSVYLGSVSKNSPFGEVKLANCNGACKAYNEFKFKMGQYCDEK